MASRIGFQKFLRKKMADGGFPTIRVEGSGKGSGDIATAAGLGIDDKGKQAKPKAYAEGGEVDGDEWGEIGGDPGYGHPYHRKNSSGEPHTNEYFEDEHPMEYMADGGMVSHYNDGMNSPDPDHHDSDPDSGPNPSYSNQHGEPDPDFDYQMQQDPDLAHEDAMDSEMANFASGGMVYHNSQGEEDEDDQDMPAMGHDDAMAHEMANFAEGGKLPKLGSGKRFENLTHKLASKGAHDPKALAAYIGRKSLGKERFQKLAAKGHAKHFAHALRKSGMR